MRWSQRADKQVVEAVVAVFCHPPELLRSVFTPLTSQQWVQSFHWLDVSGVALYMLARLQNSGMTDLLPEQVHARLQQNQADNRARSQAMFAEFADLNAAFQEARIGFCNLKGFALSRDSCSDPVLRRQLDFDFLVDGKDRLLCRELLIDRGYILRGATNVVWEFKTASDDLADIRDFYKPVSQRCAEIHFAASEPGTHKPSRDARLDHVQWMTRDDVTFPALSYPGQFVGQATHLFSHLCGSSTRLSWLLEFAEHMQAHCEEDPFWLNVRQYAAAEKDAALALGVACKMATLVLGRKVPDVLAEWTTARLPEGVTYWVERYGRRALLSDFPGTKLNLLLLDQLHVDDKDWKDRKRTALFPGTRPPRILPCAADARLSTRFRSELYQQRYNLFRLRFHLVAGLQYAIEAMRWRFHFARNRVVLLTKTIDRST